jgi:hypothetical protein
VQVYSLPLLVQLQQSWTDHSVPLVLSCYERVTFLNRLFKESSQDECLGLASHLFARAFMTNHYLAPVNEKEMQLYTSKTLKAVALAIQDPKKSVMDSTLVTVWLLGNYEV